MPVDNAVPSSSSEPYSEDAGCNPTTGPGIEEVSARVTRRGVLKGGLGAVALGLLAAGTGELRGRSAVADEGVAFTGTSPLLGFKPLPVSTLDQVVVPENYDAQVLIPWGTPLLAAGPAWKKDASNTAAEQAQQVGMHHDGMSYFPLGTGAAASTRGLLVLNHEYVDQVLLFPDGDATMTQEKVAKALAAHGVTVVEVRFERGRWRHVDSTYNRRITGDTPIAFSGPVALAHPLLQSSEAIARGTLNNCGNGQTPWGTYLACEENFNGYFGATGSFTPTPLERRYGLTANGFGYRWHPVEPRFDLSKNRNEANRFGWVVEVDPERPDSTPVKRTALGRFKHEGCAVTEGRGGVVVAYSGDDENREYVYKFVGSDAWRSRIAKGESPLDHGTLYVARFDADGKGAWLPLVHGQGPLTTANGWQDQADVLIRTRMAADAVGATKLHRPEWVAVDPSNKDVYLTLTNGSGAPLVSGRDPDTYGSVVRWREAGGDSAALTFEWDRFLLAGDPQKDDRSDVTETSRFGSPDGIDVDADGRVWIQTDISNSVQRSGAYERIGNNQMLVADPARKEVRRFLVGPNGCEVTGIAFTPDRRTLFVNIQHPGEETRAIGAPTPEDPRKVSNWPDFDPAGRPRAATVVIRKRDGSVIGT